MKSLPIQTFKLASAVCREEGLHGGVAVYVKQNIKCVERKKMSDLSVIGTFECAVAECFTGQAIIVIAIYRPPTGDISKFLDKLETVLNNVCTENKTILISGDFNIDMKNDSSNKTNLLSLMESFNLYPTISQDTRITTTTRSCIDNIFSNLGRSLKGVVIQTHLSDHTAQKLTLEIYKDTTQYHIYKRLFNKNSIDNFKNQLNQQDWQLVHEIMDTNVDKKWDMFVNQFLLLFNQSFPLRLVPKMGAKTFTYNDESLGKIKNELDVLLVLSRYDQKYQNEYKTTKIKYDKLLKVCRSKSYENRILKSENKNRTMWAICNEICGKQGRDSSCQLEGVPLDIAENYNNYLLETIKDIKNSLNASHHTVNIQENDQSLYLRPVSPDEVVDISRSLKNKFSSGDDGIPTSILRAIIEEIKTILAHLINCSFKHGIFPRQLKLALITPLFKEGDPQSLNNYRPISILSSFSKFFETAMSIRVTSFVKQCNIISETQHGYLRGKSTQTAIYQFTHSILNLLENNKLALGMFIDLSKAYDCIDRNYLIEKMEMYGIRGNALEWFSSYFSDRQQRVKVAKGGKTAKSSIVLNNDGIAQGSVIGPLAFLLFINDLNSIVDDPNSFIVNFADDTNLITGHEDIPELISQGNILFSKTKQWFEENHLAVNKNKTKIIIFSTNRTRKFKPSSIQINNEEIEISNEGQFLGVIIDEYLKWSPHIHKLSKSLNSVCYAMRVNSKYVSKNVMKTLYYANFETRMRYGIIFWGSNSEIENIFIVQKRILRVILGMDVRESCRGTFKQNNILTVHALYLYECLMFLFSNKDLFAMNKPNLTYNTRTLDLNYPIHRLTLTEKNPSYMCLRIYNKLPNELRNMEDERKFKKEIKKLLLSLEPYNLNDYFEM